MTPEFRCACGRTACFHFWPIHQARPLSSWCGECAPDDYRPGRGAMPAVRPVTSDNWLVEALSEAA